MLPTTGAVASKAQPWGLRRRTSMSSNASGQLFLSPHDLAQRVECKICGAGLGATCHDQGEIRSDPHHSRWIMYQRLVRERPFTATVRAARPGFAENETIVVMTSVEGGHLDVLSEPPFGVTRASRIPRRWVRFEAFVDEPSARAAMRSAGRRPRLRHVL